VARAFHFLHTDGVDNLKIFHRDIKSSNICHTPDYTAKKLIDCGMSKFIPEDKDASHGASVTPILKTSGAAAFGTPGSICPNYQWRFGCVSYKAACDVYSIGVVFAELIVGCLQDG
jgi:serine/threonine protein kinase